MSDSTTRSCPMETPHPRVSLWLLVLSTSILLGWGMQPVWGIEDKSQLPTNISEEALATILSNVRRGMRHSPQFAIAMLLSREACQQPTIAQEKSATIQTKLSNIKGHLDNENFVSEDNFLVAIVKRGVYKAWHAEAILVGTMEPHESQVSNSLKEFLDNRKQRYPPDNSCFILFSRLSPCLDYCLNPESDTYILTALEDSLQGFDPHFQAFAFEHVYEEGPFKGQIEVWEAWRQIPMPLFRCFFDPPKSCIRCTGTLGNDLCLDGIPPYPPDNYQH